MLLHYQHRFKTFCFHSSQPYFTISDMRSNPMSCALIQIRTCLPMVLFLNGVSSSVDALLIWISSRNLSRIGKYSQLMTIPNVYFKQITHHAPVLISLCQISHVWPFRATYAIFVLFLYFPFRERVQIKNSVRTHSRCLSHFYDSLLFL